jgi:hypothetical protein
MRVFINSTYIDLIEHRRAAHRIAWAKARAQCLEVLRTRPQPDGFPCAKAGL